MGFWDIVDKQPSMFAILALSAIAALVIVLGGRAVERTKQTQAYADAEARVAEAEARKAEASARVEEARLARGETLAS